MVTRLPGEIESLNGKRPSHLKSNSRTSVERYVAPARAFNDGARQDEPLSKTRAVAKALV